MRVHYDARSLCQFGSLLRADHEKVPVMKRDNVGKVRNTKTKK